jgi:septum formation protein
MVMSSDILYIASQSKPRQQLLDFAQISYSVLDHGSDENLDQTAYASFNDYVLAIAKSKMNAVVLPERHNVDQDYLFVLTADTLIRNPRTGKIFGKPGSREKAIAMLKDERDGAVEVVTGCCLEKYVFRNGSWQRDQFSHWTTGALVEFYVDDESMDRYLTILPIVVHCSGAGVVEDHGLSYLKSVNGSYTAVTGLPLYELRQELKKLNFRF